LALCEFESSVKLYKYLPSKYLDNVTMKGEFLFRSLSYFRDFEDEQVRGDVYEGAQKYTGDGGLEINNVTTGISSKENWIFKSKVDTDNIFIFSTSSKLCPELAKEFKSDVCIEFTNAGQIISKLSYAIKRRKSVKPNKLLHGHVNYYKEDSPPGIDWAFPDKISNSKLDYFSQQEEYRFQFSLLDALAFGNTTQEIQMGIEPKRHRKNEYPELTLKIGNIKKWCKVHEFT